MKKYETGMILITTLIILVLLASLLFSSMKGVWLYQAVAQKTRDKHIQFDALEAAASHLVEARSFKHALGCVKKTRDLNQPVSLLRSGEGCVFNDKNKAYRYAVADLGVFACVKIANHASHHWSLAIMAPDSGHEVLNIRIAEATRSRKKVCPEASAITAGVLSWRYLVD